MPHLGLSGLHIPYSPASSSPPQVWMSLAQPELALAGRTSTSRREDPLYVSTCLGT